MLTLTSEVRGNREPAVSAVRHLKAKKDYGKEMPGEQEGWRRTEKSAPGVWDAREYGVRGIKEIG